MRRIIRQWIGFIIILTGACLLCGPFVSVTLETRAQAKAVEEFWKDAELLSKPVEQVKYEDPVVVASKSETEPAIHSHAPEEVAQTEDKPSAVNLTGSDLLLTRAREYNRTLLEGGQDDIKKPDLDGFAFSTTEYGFKNNTFGTIEIPRLNLNLVIYLGGNLSNLARGVGIMGKTSLPLGEGVERCAIAGHRSTGFLRDIQDIMVGDDIIIKNPWKTLTYRAEHMELVHPNDTSWLAARQGDNQIILMTCHPYGAPTHRYLVYATLVSTADGKEEIKKEKEETVPILPPDEILELTVVESDGTRQTVQLDRKTFKAEGESIGTAYSHAVIAAENTMRPVAGVVASVTLLICIWLIITTVKEMREIKKKRGK